MKRTSLDFDKDLWRAVRVHCAEQGIRCVEFTSAALREKLARAKK